MGYEQTALPWPEAEKAFVEKGILTAEEFYALAERLRGLAFTISQITSYQALVKAKAKLQQIITDGGTLADWRVWVDEQALPWTEAYAQLVHRMAVFGSYSTGRYMQMNDPDVRAEFEYLMYDAINDLRTRPEHAAMDGKVWRRDEFPDEWWPPAGYNCFAGSTIVEGRADAAFRRWYAGDVIELMRRGSDAVTVVTPNHQIATPDGWVAAGDFQLGSTVVTNGAPPVYGRIDDEWRGPSRIMDVFGFMAEFGGLGVDRIGRNDFHGDVLTDGALVDVARLAGTLPIGADVKKATGERDRITMARRARFTGYVYNLETPEGAYLADGMVVSNCRCEVRPLNDTMMDRLGYDTPDIERGVPVDEDGQPLHADPGFQSNQADIWTLEHLLESALRGIKTEAGR